MIRTILSIDETRTVSEFLKKRKQALGLELSKETTLKDIDGFA